jgi:hypothetical protein
MSDIKLNKEELAALDLLIESMKAEQEEGGVDPQRAWPAVTARVTRAAIKATRRATPQVARTARRATPVLRVATRTTPTFVGSPARGGPQEEGFEEAAALAEPELSLEELIELRKVVSSSEE